ncbi:MFS transporter [Rhizohabitans arisaemae]|uniref:MFS transporter n=1 Tax=Rhizohabitans arisaemae TaxID=2720610 RepID=UPI0024B1ECA9|nr:MFS transporter [Rhizohabitans arisaemae]
MLVVTLIAFEAMAVGTVMPEVSRELNAFDLYAWSFSAFLMAGLLVNVIAGLWSDSRGPLLPMVLGLGLFIAGMAMAGVVGSKELFIIARAIQGFGAGAVIVAMYVLIAQAYAQSLQPKIFAALSAAWVLPSLIGPAVAGFVAQAAGWRWVFLGTIPLVIPGFLLLLPVLRRTGAPPEEAGAPATGRARPAVRTVAAIAVAAGATAILYGIDNLRSGALPIAATVAGTAMLLLGLPRLLPAGALRLGRGLPTTIVMRGFLAAAFFGVNSFIPWLLTDVHSFSTTNAGIALTTGAVGWSLGSYLQARRSYDRINLVRWGAVCVALGIAGTVAIGLPGVSGWVAVPVWMVAGLGMGVAITSVNVTMLRQSPVAEQGVNSAALQVCDTLGASLAIGAGGAIINAIGRDRLAVGFTVTVVAMALLAAFSSVAALRMRER